MYVVEPSPVVSNFVDLYLFSVVVVLNWMLSTICSTSVVVVPCPVVENLVDLRHLVLEPVELLNVAMFCSIVRCKVVLLLTVLLLLFSVVPLSVVVV